MANNANETLEWKRALEKALRNVCDHHHVDSMPGVVQVDSIAILTPENADKFLTEKSLTSDALRADLHLFARLSKAHLPPESIEAAVLDTEPHAFADVIAKRFVQWSKDSKTGESARSLFKSDPALVTASLIESRIFTLPDEVRPKIVDVLRKRPDELNFLQRPVQDMVPDFHATLDDGQQRVLMKLLQVLQNLSCVTVDPMELQKLINLGYGSAEDIAYTSWDAFKAAATRLELKPERAREIRRQAMSVQIRAEQTWMTMLHGHRMSEVFTGESNAAPVESNAALVSGSNVARPSHPESHNVPSPAETLADWFGDLDEMACEECNSVTSPSAYLVDLLRMLHAQKALPDHQETTLLRLLFQRRPDIGKLELSCRNTNDLVSYLDLANEVMESAVLNLTPGDLEGVKYDIQAFNANGDIPGDQAAEVAQNTQIRVYDEFLNARVFPSSIFPFEYSRTVLEQYLAGCGSTLAEVREAFWPMHGAVSQLDQVEEALERSLRRARAADGLGISNKDHLALTGEGIWSPLFNGPGAFETSPLEEKPRSIPEYWGYGASDTVTMIESAQGLTLVKAQLLPRLGIDFATLYDILQTGFMNGELTVSLTSKEGPIDKTKSVPTQLENFRLRGKGGRALTQEDDGICNRLAQFVRVWQRLRWSVAEVDDALYHFGAVRGAGDAMAHPPLITPEVFQQLSAMQDLARATSWQPKRLIAMWNAGSAYFEELKGYYTKSTDLKAAPASPESRNRSLALFLATIQMTYQDYLLVKITQDLGDELDVQTIFVYTRKQSLANLFGVPVGQVDQLLTLLSPDESPEKTPELLLRTWRYWQRLKANGWDAPTLGEANLVIDPKSAHLSDTLRERSRAFMSQMVKAFAQLLQANTVKSTQDFRSVADPTKNMIRTALSHSVEDGLMSILPKTDRGVLNCLLDQDTRGLGKSARDAIMDAIFKTWSGLSESYALSSGGASVLASENCEINLDLPLDFTGQVRMGGQTKILPASSTVRTKSVTMTIEKDVLTPISWDLKPMPSELTLMVSSPYRARVTLAVMTAPATEMIEAAIADLNAQVYISNCNNLSVNDLGILYGPNHLQWDGSKFDKAELYNRIRQNFQAAAPKFDFATFYLWMSQPTGIHPPEELDAAMQLPRGFFRTLLEANFPGASFDQLRLGLGQERVLERLSLQVALLNRLSLSLDAIKALMGFAFPHQPHSTMAGTQPATEVVRLIKAAQLGKGRTATVRNVEDQLRVLRRQALVAYLLQLPFFKTRILPITDANGLFEFFLIDVQMGACLETSRIKQAISTVQLFVQRCLLGLEHGVDPTIIDQPRWSWMQKYNLWEANRKVFLYPENWADPTLRDNKTEAFKLVEASIMQTKLDEKTISKMIRTYVHQIDHIACLRMEALLWVPVSSLVRSGKSHSPSEGQYHFFARTRNAPYEFYYRSMSYLSTAALPTASWRYWQKIPFDIRTHDTSAAGDSLTNAGSYLVPAFRDGRLFLFLPQVMYKVIAPKDPSKSVNLTGENQVLVENKGNSATKTNKTNLKVSATDAAAQSSTDIEIRLSWSEYVEGIWSPPVQAHEVLKLPSEHINPQVQSFRFLVDTSDKDASKSDSNISIYVLNTPPIPESATPTSGAITQTKTVGKFTLQGLHLLTVDSDSPLDKLASAPSTSFGRLPIIYNGSVVKSSQSPDTDDNKKGAWPALSRPKPYSKILSSQPIFWTIDSNLTRIALDKTLIQSAGLVADFPSAEELGSELWFTLPEFARKDPTTSGGEQDDDELSTTLHNPLGRKLKQAVIEEDGLEKIFELMDEMQLPDAKPDEVDPRSEEAKKLKKDGKQKEAEQLENDIKAETQAKRERSRIYKDAFGLFNNLKYCYENGTPYAIYNWELGFHLVSLIVERLFSLQQFDLAIKYAHLVFDPTLAGIQGKDVWRFPPFRSTSTREAGTIDALFGGMTATSGSDEDKTSFFLQWEKHPFMPHVVARGRPLAYMKRFVMKYIEILIASGDQHYRQPSMEAIPLAIQRYIEASHVLGAKPQKVPRAGSIPTKTYEQLAKDIDTFSNAAVQFHLQFPYTLPSRSGDAIAHGALPGWARTRYFGVQSNHQFLALRDVVDDRLQKIRNCLDIDGNPRKLRLFDPPIDPGALVRVAASNTGLGAVLDAFQGPLPKQRFMYLLQKAQELCSELRQMANAFLVTVEKREGEGLQLLRATQDATLQTFLIDLKLKERKEAEKGIEYLRESRRSAVVRLKFYSDLTGEKQKPPEPDSDFDEIKLIIPEPSKDDLRLTSHELMELEMADASHVLNGLAINQEYWASLLSKIPSVSVNVQPMGVGASTQIPNLGEIFEFEASGLRAKASMALEMSQRGSRMAQFTQQLQERQLQLNLAGREIKSIDKQIETQMAHVEVLDHGILSQRKLADHAAAAEEFLRSKFTRADLYGWLEGSTRQLIHQVYDLSMQLARQAEKCFAFETGDAQTSFINAAGYWDGDRQGIDAGDNLWLALKRMEIAYEQGVYHDFEISKDISLRQVSAHQLIQLRRTGTAQFTLPEALFDLDFPGHYRRRIKAVAVSLHCITGPYTGVSATLALTKHAQRITDRVESGTSYLGQRPDDGFRESNPAPPISAIAISTGHMDSGVFELDFRSRSFQPFEGAGAISEWTLRLPAEYRQFDYNTISDVVLHLRYTSKGSDNLRDAAVGGLTEYLQNTRKLSQTFGLNMLISVRSDYPDAWSRLRMRMPKNNTPLKRSVQLSHLRSRLPYFLKTQQQLVVLSITFYISFTTGKLTKPLILPDVGNNSNNLKPEILLEDQDSAGPGAGHTTVFRWPAKSPSTQSEPSKKLANLLVDESMTLDFELDLDDVDPGAGQDVLIVLEYQLSEPRKGT